MEYESKTAGEVNLRSPSSCWVNIRKIAVFRALQLGDMLCAVPALRALRKAAPGAEITLIGLPWAEQFVRRFSCHVDRFIAFPGYPGMPEQQPAIHELPGFIKRIQEENFDLAVQMHGSGVLTNPLVMTFGARSTAGFYPAGMRNPDPSRYLEWRDEEHEIFRLLDLVECLGAPSEGATLEFPLTEMDYGQARTVAPALLRKEYVCVHPGAQLPSRRWPPERFAAVADRLHAAGFAIVLTGTAGERALVTSVRDAMRCPALDACGATDLGGLAALLSDARMVICNDTGVSHVATAVGTPSVIIASGSDTRRWAPLNRLRHRTLSAQVPCRPCMEFSCPIPGHPCATAVTVDMVMEQVNHILSVPEQRRISAAEAGMPSSRRFRQAIDCQATT